MTKPAEAMQLEVECDLSEAAIEDAINLMFSVSEWIDLESFPAIAAGERHFYCLCVASQGMSAAAVLGGKWGIRVELDFNYEPDEWSIQKSHWSEPHGRKINKTVWSSGA